MIATNDERVSPLSTNQYVPNGTAGQVTGVTHATTTVLLDGQPVEVERSNFLDYFLQLAHQAQALISELQGGQA